MNNQVTPCRESFVFYRSFYESIKRLPDDVQIVLFRAVVDYGLDQVVPDFTGVPYQPFVEAIFAGIRPQLDANHKRFLNGCKGGEFGHLGGAPKGNVNAKKQPQNNPETTPNDNENENDNDNENVNVKVAGKPRKRGEVQELTLPFQDPEFVSTWNELRNQPKWKPKGIQALQMALKQLSQYHVRFAIWLMQNAISGNYQGVVFNDTPEKYQRWLSCTPLDEREPTKPVQIVNNSDNLYND